MSSYEAFAFYYDHLTKNVNYPERADYYCTLFSRLNHNMGITLDLACGTGSLTLELKKRGIDVYGIDGSSSMLSIAQEKAIEQQVQILFLCQKMQELDLYGTVDTVLCTLDSINHLTTEQDVQKAFQKVSLFLNPDGYFVFDLNTIYKHKTILANHTFIYDTDTVFCTWQNHYFASDHRVEITLDFFEKQDNQSYLRYSECFFERAYTIQTIEKMLNHAGLSLVAVYDDLSFQLPVPTSQRVVCVAQKQEN